MEEYGICLCGLKKSFGEGIARTEVLKGIDLKIKKGEFCAVMGTSGCGKSTLLSILAGLEQGDGGTCTVNGLDVGKMNEKERARYRNREIGIVFQAFYLDEMRTILENVEMPLGYGGVRKKERRRRAGELLEELGLKDIRNKRPSQVSGGQQQRAAIARALINHPSFLLADEPTGNLDEENTNRVMELLAGLHQRGMGILMVTHDEAVASYAERIVVIEQGVIKDGGHKI